MLDSLPRRPRGRRLARLLGKRPAPPPPVAPAPPPAWDPLRRSLLAVPEAPGPVSSALHARLTAADLEAMRARLTPAEHARLAGAGERERVQLELSLAVAYAPEAEDRTGLSRAEPPEDVHAVLRGPEWTGGAFRYADSLVEVLVAAGGDPGRARAVLDFGCSSGRLVRALAPVYPEVRWHGCDPNGPAVAWAAEHFPEHAWLRSELDPPLPYDDGTFDAVLALSIWSHFGEREGLAWFEEMHRVLAPGGLLAFTSHGLHTLRHLAERDGWAHEDLHRAMEDLYATGFHHRDVFGEAGDWGVPGGPGWGWAFMSPEWVQAKLCPAWAVAEFRPGYVDEFQDLTVLARR